MAIVRIIAPNQTDRLKSLAGSICRFGSDFGCDVVLIDDNILAEHFTLRLDEGGVSILMHPGAEGDLEDRNGNLHKLESGVVHPWPVSHHLRTAGIEVHLGGAPVRIPDRRPTAAALLTRAMTGRPRLGLFAVSAGMALLGIGNVNTSAWLNRPSAAFSAVSTEAEAQTSGGVRPLSEIRAFLQERGFNPQDLQFQGNMLDAVFYVDNVAERDAANVTLEALGTPLRAQFHLRPQLLSAIRIILEAAEGKAELVDLQDGHVLLSGPRKDDSLRETVRSRILSDVPGIRSVQFADPADAMTDDLAGDIAAVWLGTRPYVVLKDGRIIRPGQSLSTDAVLLNVLSVSKISVRINDHVEEVAVR